MSIQNRIRSGSRRALALGLAAVAGLAIAGPLGIATDTARAAEAPSVKEFAFTPVYMQGFLHSAPVASYTCPPGEGYKYLENKSYAPIGTSLPHGVEIRQEREPWPVGVSITGVKGIDGERSLAYGTSDAPIKSSATNWAFGNNWYQVVLHCTNDPAQGWTTVFSD